MGAVRSSADEFVGDHLVVHQSFSPPAGEALSDEQISDAVMGLAAAKPNWTGHAALVLRTLKPVGGKNASFEQAGNLSEAIQALLKDKEAPNSLVEVSLSTAEHGTNASGHAALRLKVSGAERTVYFVHQLAASLHGKGAEKNYDPHDWGTSSARHLVLSRSFFDDLARRIATLRRLKPGPSSDGSEYDAVEAEQRRLTALGVRKGSRYLNVGVDNQVTWPRTETLVTFGRYTMVLLPKTKENVQSISMDLAGNRIGDKKALAVVNRFLSLLCFCDDQYAVRQDGWSGNPVPVGVPRRNLAFTTTTTWLFDRKIPESPDAQRALALYREARNAEQNFLVSYAVLNFYKIIEILHPKGPQTRAWLAKTFETVATTIPERMLKLFHEERGATPPEKHIYDSYRLAVAHVSSQTPSNPDDAHELRRLYTAAEVLRPIARYFMIHELGITDQPYEERDGD